MAEEKSGGLDLAGLGKVAEAIPDESWNKAVETVTNTFTDLLAPLTKTTVGLGKLIEAKFDRMTEIEKVFTVDVVNKARQKARESKRPFKDNPSSRIIVGAIEQASIESNSDLREIWANLIANEMTGIFVHPEFPTILAKLSPADATQLAEIANADSAKNIQLRGKDLISAIAKVVVSTIPTFGVDFKLSLSAPKSRAREEYLERLGLLTSHPESGYHLTDFGREFIVAVTEPPTSPDS